MKRIEHYREAARLLERVATYGTEWTVDILDSDGIYRGQWTGADMLAAAQAHATLACAVLEDHGNDYGINPEG